MEKKTALYLPHELMIEILLRLPVKSLLRFKCVCKSWFSLISDPCFANSQFQLTTHTHRVMWIQRYPTEFYSIDFEAFLNYDLHPASLSMNFSLPPSHLSVIIIGSCRGFILLYHHRELFLWNPSTGFKKQISLSPYGYDHPYGFGYDQSRDDYLIVVLYHDATSFSSHLEFFSIRDNSWKEIEGTHLPSYDLYSKGLLFNGVIHWLALRSDLEIEVIAAFDLTERKLFEMPLPGDYDQELYLDLGLWVFEEFLSLWVKDDPNGIIEIWVMKEYKLNSSWTKTLVLPLQYISSFDFKPMISINNGDIIGTSQRSMLLKCNYKGQVMRDHSFCNGLSNNIDNIVMYTESLLSFPYDNWQNYKLEE